MFQLQPVLETCHSCGHNMIPKDANKKFQICGRRTSCHRAMPPAHMSTNHTEIKSNSCNTLAIMLYSLTVKIYRQSTTRTRKNLVALPCIKYTASLFCEVDERQLDIQSIMFSCSSGCCCFHFVFSFFLPVFYI